MHYDHDDCCRGKVKCPKPKSPRDIKTECIFVEKVFDSRIFRTQEEIEQREEFLINKTLRRIIPGTLEVSCEIEEFKTIPQIWIDGQEVDTSCPFPGPGGVKQFDLSGINVDNSDCFEKGKGTKVNVKQRIKVWFKVLLKITGKGIDENGMEVDFESRKQPVTGDFRFKSKFDMCMPNNKAVFPVSIADICGANCFFDKDRARVKPSAPNNIIQVEGDIRFCIRCEKKIKAAVELCVLSTGLCREPEVEFGICGDDDFPDLFPVKYLDDGEPVLYTDDEEIEIIEEPLEEENEE